MCHDSLQGHRVHEEESFQLLQHQKRGTLELPYDYNRCIVVGVGISGSPSFSGAGSKTGHLVVSKHFEKQGSSSIPDTNPKPQNEDSLNLKPVIP